MGLEVTQDDRRAYRSRFTANKLWHNLLKSVITWFGSERLTGLMAHYKNPKRVVR
jgi:hypothetical protein